MIKNFVVFRFLIVLLFAENLYALDFHSSADVGDLRIHLVASRMSGGRHIANTEEPQDSRSVVFFQIQVYLENISEDSTLILPLGGDSVKSEACVVTALYSIRAEKDVFGGFLKPSSVDLRIVELRPAERALLDRFRLFRQCEAEDVALIVSYRVSSQIAEFYPVWSGVISANLLLNFAHE
jgi:hypothetical protein